MQVMDATICRLERPTTCSRSSSLLVFVPCYGDARCHCHASTAPLIESLFGRVGAT